jgi:hypothetical protein
MVKAHWTKMSAFAHFGAKATNVRWGWSARSDDGKTVVVTVWDDEFDADDPSSVLDVYGHKNLARWSRATGNHDRIRNLLWARDQCGGQFRIIVATARDVDASPRSALGFRPHPRVMRLTNLDDQTGEFRAVSW